MPDLNRRALLGVAAALPMAGVVMATSASAPDPILQLHAERGRLQKAAWAAADALDAEYAKLPDWAAADNPSYPRSKREPAMRHTLADSGNSYSLAMIRQGNRATEDFVRPLVGDFWDTGDRITSDERAERLAEWNRRRAEGRARVRWWISERRLMNEARADYERANAANEAAWGALYDAERQIVATPASSLEGVRVKLELVAEFLGGEKEEMEIEDQLAVSAFDDLTRVLAAA